MTPVFWQNGVIHPVTRRKGWEERKAIKKAHDVINI